MRRIGVFEQRPIFQQVNAFFELVKKNESIDPFLKGVYLERAIDKNIRDFPSELDRLYAHIKVDSKLIHALGEINRIFLILNPDVYVEVCAHIRNVIEKEIKILRENGASKFDEAKAKSRLFDFDIKTDSSWRNPSPDIQPRTHTPFSSGEDEESGKSLTK